MEQQRITFDTFVRGLIGVIIIVFIIWLLNKLSGALTPFFLAWLIAYILFPMVRFFQVRCRMKYRILGILSTFIIVGGILTGIFFLVIPPMIEESLHVKDLLVGYLSQSETLSNIPNTIQKFLREHFTIDEIKGFVTQEGFIETAKVAVPKAWDVVMQSFNVLSSILSLTMVVLYTLFILLDYEKISKGWPNLLPVNYRGFAVQLMNDIEEGMNKYFRGQALVALCVGIDFPMAIGLGLFIGFLNMGPYLQLVGFVPTILLAIVKAAETGENFWMVLFMALLVFAVVQLIQDSFLTPKIMGKVTGLNSAIILLSLSIWGTLLGVLGMIIALPMTTLMLTYYQRYIIKKKET